jgi:hypothetical protein
MEEWTNGNLINEQVLATLTSEQLQKLSEILAEVK